MKLLLGVIDQPYTSWTGGKKAAAPGRRSKRAPAGRKGVARTVTTGDVAEWLEDRYHVMEVFFEDDGGVLALLEESVQDSIEDLLMGAPSDGNPFAAGTSTIESRFKRWLSNGSIERLGIPGVPTRAALMGISSRFKAGRNGGLVQRRGKSVMGVRRPSFIDTGLYQASFKAWVE